MFRVDNRGLVVLEAMAVIVTYITSRELPPREQNKHRLITAHKNAIVRQFDAILT